MYATTLTHRQSDYLTCHALAVLPLGGRKVVAETWAEPKRIYSAAVPDFDARDVMGSLKAGVQVDADPDRNKGYLLYSYTEGPLREFLRNHPKGKVAVSGVKGELVVTYRITPPIPKVYELKMVKAGFLVGRENSGPSCEGLR